MKSGPVVVVVKADLRRVALPPGVLPEQVRDEHGLIPEVRRVQLAVGVLLEHVEVGGVELIAIARVIPKEPNSQIRVAEDKAAKVADERLNARPNRSRVEVRAVAIIAAAALDAGIAVV